MPRLAVVIPTFNEAKCLPSLLEALQRQTLLPDDVVVADAHSSDDTRAIAQRFGARIVDGGNAAEGRNAGAAATTADVIVFLDADAILDNEHFLACAVSEFTARRLDLATADVVVTDGNTVDWAAFAFYNAYVRAWGAHHPHPIGTFMLVRRTVHDVLGGFDPLVTFAEDHDYGLRARDAGFTFGVLRGVMIGTTARRQRRIGRVRFYLINALAEPYILLAGSVRSRIVAQRYDGK